MKVGWIVLWSLTFVGVFAILHKSVPFSFRAHQAVQHLIESFVDRGLIVTSE
jgi:hypothetical protein